MYLPRTIGSFFTQALGQFPVILLTGPRQVGKTTCLRHHCAEGRAYVTLDDPLACRLAKADPALFLQRYSGAVLIDEIQYAPELLPHIKMAVDENREPGKFWLTGSQQFHLMQGVSESLAGRVAIANLLGFSRRELLGQADTATPFLPTGDSLTRRMKSGSAVSLQDLYRHIWRGSFPAIAISDAMDRDLFYSSFVQTYLQRDIRDLARVGDEMAFLRFLRAAAARSGQLLNMSDMARDADVTPTTAKSWLSMLQTSGIVYLLEPYHSNVTKRLVKAPKLYFLDTGLTAYLTEWSSPETLEAGAMSGAILETWVVTEILKSYWHNGRRAPLYYYRDKDKKEVDLLIVQDGGVYPLEIKRTAAPKPDDARHFQVLERLGLPVGPGGVICLSQVLVPLTERVHCIPMAVL